MESVPLPDRGQSDHGRKFRAWSDCDDLQAAFTKDEILADIGLYRFTGCIGASFWPYCARMHVPWPIPKGRTVDVPTGYGEFPREILRPPRSLPSAPSSTSAAGA